MDLQSILTQTSAITVAFLVITVKQIKDKIIKKCEKKLSELRSLTAGVGISYLFIHLLPNFIEKTNGSTIIFLTAIIGFTTFYIIEEKIYEKTKRKKQIKKKLAIEDTIISTIYSITIGILLAELSKVDPKEIIFIAAPLILHSAFTGPTKYKIKNKLLKAITKTSIFIGLLIGYITIQYATQEIIISIMGFVTGAIFFLVTRHLLPKKETPGTLKYFITGATGYTIIILILMMLETLI